MWLLDDDQLERSAVVANCRMNRERNLRGSNGYERELGFDPLEYLRDRSAESGRPVGWLDLCCGTGKALAEAAKIVDAEGLEVQVVGVDLVGMFVKHATGVRGLRLVESSLSGWSPGRFFDLITCVHGLHYVGDKLCLIARAVSWLVEDGLFVANLDARNLRIAGPNGKAQRIGPALRRAGMEFDSRNRRVVRRGRAQVQFGCEYLGADDQAGPNFTGQAAVDSYYRWR